MSRTERDPLGERRIPTDARDGMQTRPPLEHAPAGVLPADTAPVAAIVLSAKAGDAARCGGRDFPLPGHRDRLVALVFCVLASFAGVAASAWGQETPRHGRLFAPQDLGLLETPDRDAWQKPDQIMDTLAIADGGVVADLGAGGGWFTIRLARRVGPNGKVYAEDIQPQMIEAIERRVRREGLTNVRTVRGTPADPGLPPDALDAALIVDAFHEMEDPVALLRNVARALKPQGRVGIIDYRQGEGGPGPARDERIPPELIVQAAAAAGLRVLRQETFLPYQYFLVLGRP